MYSTGPSRIGKLHNFVSFCHFVTYNKVYFSRMDSTIPAPYNKFVYYDSRTKQREQNRNYAANKTKKIGK